MARLKHGIFLALAISANTLWSASATAALSDEAREAAGLEKRVAAILAVMRDAHVDPDNACVSALDEMHTTDQQLRQLSGAMQYDNETAPVLEHNSGEMGIGRDVLISDMQTTVSTCGPAAETACSSGASAGLRRSCVALRRTTPIGGGSN